MPLLNTSRFSRPIRGMVAGAALIGGLSGPVGSAGAGVPAAFHGGQGSATVVSATPAASSKASSHRDRLGTHKGMPFPNLAKRLSSASFCGSPYAFGSSFQTQLGPSWTDLSARSYACRSAPLTGSWPANTKFTVSQQGMGENVCQSTTAGQASNLWYKTSRGWVWSGGTTSAIWNTTC